jgi:hypothetical protein
MLSRQIVWQGRPVHSWADFNSVVKPERELLGRLDDYDDSVLVAGCQRSGTTAVARLFKRVDGIADYGFGPDDELDGALLLAGYVDRLANGRHCFQTTYLNDRFPEYFDHEGFRLVWMLREPRSVVYSMLHNWGRGALNRLFEACGEAKLDKDRPRSLLKEWIGPSRLDKACASYIAKTEQTRMLREKLGDRMAVIDYDDLVSHKDVLLPQLCAFVDVPYERDLTRQLHGKSVRNGNRLSDWESDYVDNLCGAAYRAARLERTIGAEYGDDRK